MSKEIIERVRYKIGRELISVYEMGLAKEYPDYDFFLNVILSHKNIKIVDDNGNIIEL